MHRLLMVGNKKINKNNFNTLKLINMKKFLIAGLILVSFVSSAFASDNDKVSRKAIINLEANYAAAENVLWTVTENYVKASFTIYIEKIDVFYDGNGDLLCSSKNMDFDKLPKEAITFLTTAYQFPDYQLIECIEFTDADNSKRYYVSFDINGESIVLSISASGIVSEI